MKDGRNCRLHLRLRLRVHRQTTSQLIYSHPPRPFVVPLPRHLRSDYHFVTAMISHCKSRVRTVLEPLLLLLCSIRIDCRIRVPKLGRCAANGNRKRTIGKPIQTIGCTMLPSYDRAANAYKSTLRHFYSSALKQTRPNPNKWLH